MKKKKIAFFAGTLDIGGIERAIINYVNEIDKNKYKVTLFLENKCGVYLDEVNSDVEIIDFKLNNNKNVLLRKIFNAIRLVLFSIKYYHRYDFAANFKTTSKAGSILVKRFSLNNAYWFHGNYWSNKEEARIFLKHFNILKYKKIVFVSHYSKKLYENVISSNQELYVINNPTNYKEIIKKSEEELDLSENRKILLNVGRHFENEKKLSLMLQCIKKLKDDGYVFLLWLLGNGPDTDMYKEMVKKLDIGDYVKFLGFSNNVYPYIKRSDAILLSSKTEGNPVVFLEAKILNKTVISTDVADARSELDGFGIVTENNLEAFYEGVKNFLDNGYNIKNKFNPQKYNKLIFEKLDEVIEK